MNILISNVRLLDDERGVRRDVYISGSRIAGIDEKPEGFTPEVTIDGSHRLCMPGLVNAHTHAYMSVFRNYADDLPFEEWLFGKIDPLEGRMTPEQAYWGTMLSITEMIRTGTTCFIDMHMFPNTCVRACADSGIRAFITRGVVGEDRRDEGGQRRLREAFEEIEYAKSEPKAHVRFGLGPHAIYTCGEDFLRYVGELAAERQLPINMHLAETQFEYDSCMKEHGMSPVAYVKSLGLFHVPAILAHCVHLTDEDMESLCDPNVTVVTNPASNMKLGNGFAPVAQMLKEGICVGLGTDGASSNNALNMFREMGLLTLTQKGANLDCLALTAEETLKVALDGGYRAAGLADEGGRVEKGRLADLILLDEEAPNFQPKHSMKAALAYSSTGFEVTDTIVNGEILMRDRRLTTIDEERVNGEIARAVSGF